MLLQVSSYNIKNSRVAMGIASSVIGLCHVSHVMLLYYYQPKVIVQHEGEYTYKTFIGAFLINWIETTTGTVFRSESNFWHLLN